MGTSGKTQDTKTNLTKPKTNGLTEYTQNFPDCKAGIISVLKVRKMQKKKKKGQKRPPKRKNCCSKFPRKTQKQSRGLEPLHGVLLGQTVGESNLADLSSPVGNVHAGPAEDDKEVHAVDANAWVVLDSQVNVLLDAEAEVAVVGEVLLPQLVLLHIEAPLENLLGLGAPDGAV